MSAIMLHVQFHVVIKPLSSELYKDDRASCLNKTRFPCGHEAISSNSMRNKNVACNCIYCYGIHSVVTLFSDRKCTLIQVYYVLVYNEVHQNRPCINKQIQRIVVPRSATNLTLKKVKGHRQGHDMVPPERSCHKEHTCQVSKLYL